MSHVGPPRDSWAIDPAWEEQDSRSRKAGQAGGRRVVHSFCWSCLGGELTPSLGGLSTISTQRTMPVISTPTLRRTSRRPTVGSNVRDNERAVLELLSRIQHGLDWNPPVQRVIKPWAIVAVLALGKSRVLRVIRLLFRSLAFISKLALPAGTAGFLFAFLYNRLKQPKQRRPVRRVAVVGGGIAGCGAAWALDKAGVDVVIYEKKPTLGGNAKTYAWDVGGRKVKTGLSVLAWPDNLFHSYNAFIDELGVPTEHHDLCYFVAERTKHDVDCVFAHGRPGWTPEPWLQQDLKRWERLASFVRGVNRVMQPAATQSLYRVNALNPLNLVPLRRLCSLFGISSRFWDFVFVPVHTSTFLEVSMDDIPAVMAEILDDIVPFNTVPRMRTWSTDPGDVFDRLRARLRPSSVVKTACAAERVEFECVSQGEGGGMRVVVLDEDDHSETFDAVVFACSAPALNRMLHGAGPPAPGVVISPNHRNGLDEPGASLMRWALGRLEEFVLSSTKYTVDRDKVFVRGVVHSDPDAVFPQKFRDELLMNHCNYVEVDRNNSSQLENTFILSSWAPPMQDPALRGKKAMLVTYADPERMENVESEWTVTSREAHPCLTTWQMLAATQLWPLFQGSRDGCVYFCGSAVTPGNGHDLSFLSGLVAAAELGAPFPYPAKSDAVSDFGRLRRMMLSWWS